WVTADLRALFLVGPKTGHAWHPDSKTQSDAFIVDVLKTAGVAPSRVRFVTYTTRFNKAHWLSVEGLEATYERADVDARRTDQGNEYVVETKHVTALRFENAAARFTIDGQALKAGPTASFEKSGGKWVLGSTPASGLRKIHGLQGPVDDAFMDAFVCVRPTGAPWNQVTRDWAAPTLETFRRN